MFDRKWLIRSNDARKKSPMLMIKAVPSPIDFADVAQARAWVADTVRRRPGRLQFGPAFAAALNACFNTIRVVELGSGHLADAILRR